MKYIIIAVLALLPLTSHAYFDSSLKLGNTGQAVTELQEFLISEECLAVNPTGYFGFLTLKGVKCFQAKHGIEPVSGFFGVLSRTKANEIVSKEVAISSEEEKKEIGAAPSTAPTPSLPTETPANPPIIGSVPMPEPTVIVTPSVSPTPSVVDLSSLTLQIPEANYKDVGFFNLHLLFVDKDSKGVNTIEMDKKGNPIKTPDLTIKLIKDGTVMNIYRTKEGLSKDSYGNGTGMSCPRSKKEDCYLSLSYTLLEEGEYEVTATNGDKNVSHKFTFTK